MPHDINPFAERFALKTGGALLVRHGLNLAPPLPEGPAYRAPPETDTGPAFVV